MSIYHCSIKIISRAGGRSAVASAAYRSGEKLTNHETGIVHDFTAKGGVIMSEILLPENAPEKYLDREKLWNDVQKVEARSDARFAREIEVALPVEMDRIQQVDCVRGYIKKNFTSKGMIADWALHDKGDGNPHAHIMLTCRGINENHEWDKKTRTVFANAKDDRGRPVYDPDKPTYDPKDKENTAQYRIPVLDENGQQKFRERKGKGREMLWERINIPANDWNDKANAELWRQSWAECCNIYLPVKDHIDHRSYERQGVDREPTIHEGVTARKIEQEGKISDRAQINREIRERNSIRDQMKQTALEITKAIADIARRIYERFERFGRGNGDTGEAGRDDGHSGKTADGIGAEGCSDPESERRAGRISELKRDIEQRKQETEGADTVIAKQECIVNHRKEETNERIRKLMERRKAFGRNGGDAGSDRTAGGQEYRTGSGSFYQGELDTEVVLREVRSAIGSAGAKEKAARADRLHREAERRAEQPAGKMRQPEQRSVRCRKRGMER